MADISVDVGPTLSETEKELVRLLMQASERGDSIAVKKLLEDGAEDIIALARDEKTGQTPLHRACAGGHQVCGKRIALILITTASRT